MSARYNRSELRTVRRLIVPAIAGLVLAVAAVVLSLTGPAWTVEVALGGCAAVTAPTVVAGLRLHRRVEARWQREGTP